MGIILDDFDDNRSMEFFFARGYFSCFVEYEDEAYDRF